jgi:hypothetical protein
MYSRPGTIIALLMGAFPFLALGYKLFEDSAFGGVIYALIILILVVGIMIAVRAQIVLPEAAAAGSETRAARQPSAPITWSWDGVDRQPEGAEAEADDSQAQTH